MRKFIYDAVLNPRFIIGSCKLFPHEIKFLKEKGFKIKDDYHVYK